MRTNTMLSILIAGTAIVATSPFARAQAPETKEPLENKLKAQYILTKLTADRTGIVKAGAVLTLKKDGFLMVPSTSALICSSQYKGGKISISLIARALCEKGVPGSPGSARKFVAGEKLNVVRIDVKDKAVVFDLYSVDAYANAYYRGELSFPSEKGNAPTASQVLTDSSEVFDVTLPEDTKTAPVAAPQPAASFVPQSGPPQPQLPPIQADPSVQTALPDSQPKYADIPPPPPPPPPTQELKKGLTVDQVVAQLGQPVTTAKVSDTKQIYLFKDWKITFIDGKVADIDVR